MINFPLTTVVDGKTWRLFDIQFNSDDRVYSVYIYAINREHASYRLQDLKDTGRLGDGEIVDIK
ncbi:hypothetical protein RA241_003713 [Cronobacter sakazakii]|nr:hypothetical protein [Cronobacter sakazakii]